MATAWSSRSSGYKAGVGGLLLGFLWYLLGFALPIWLTAGIVDVGLWQSCLDLTDYDECTATVGVKASWFRAVQVLECVGLTGLVAASLFAVITNCRHAFPATNRFLEAVSAFSGACGFISCMVFVGKTPETYEALDREYGWGFSLNLAGSILVVISAVVIGIGNRPSLANAASAGAVIRSGGVPAMQGVNTVVVQQSAVYPAPAALGMQPAYGYDQGVSVSAQYPGGFPPAPPQAGYPGGFPPAPPQAGYPGGFPPAPPQAGYPGGFPPTPPQAGYPGGFPPAPPQAGYASPAAYGGNK